MSILKHFALFTPADENIINDREALVNKTKVMRSLRWNSMLNSVSKVSTFIGAPLLTFSLLGALKEVLEPATQAAVASAEAGAVALPLIGALSLPVAAALIVGVAFVGLAVATDYAASRIWQSRQFDNYEISAQSTAKHLVQEIKASNACLESEQPARTGGKTWAQAVESSRTTQPGQSL